MSKEKVVEMCRKCVLNESLVWGAGMLSHGMIFHLGPAKLCSPVTIETYFSYDKDIWISVSDYHIYFNLIVLFILVIIYRYFLSLTLFSLLVLVGPLHN